MKVKLEKGSGSIHFSIAGNMVIDTLTGRNILPLSHEKIKKTIAKGIKETSPANIVNKKIAVLIPDHTRLWARGDIFVPVIIKTLLEQGVPRKNIKIIIALGSHADLDQNEFAALAGDFCVNEIDILNSANKNDDRLVYCGKTKQNTELFFTKEACESDHIIIFGGILHHLIAGFGGGRKYILPGIAGYDSIQQNHSLSIRKDGTPHPLVKQMQLENNPVNEDMEEAAEIFLKDKTCSCIAVAVNGAGDIFHAEAGFLKETFLKGCEKLNTACRVTIPEKGDFALISAGGHRSDGQLYQATKALVNASNCVKENGRILFVAEAKEGVGNKTFESILKNYKHNPEKIGEKLTMQFDMPSYVAFRIIDLLNRFNVTLVSNFSEPETMELGFKYTDSIEDYINSSLAGKGYIIPFAENILPAVHKG